MRYLSAASPHPTMAYTFKDDGARLTYFRDYNKEVGTGDNTLVGNWVEERALRDMVETGRYKQWVNPSGDPLAPQKTYHRLEPRPDTLDTYRRTVVHSDHTPSEDYETTNEFAAKAQSAYVYPPKGAREALLEERARKLAEATAPPPDEPPEQYATTSRLDYSEKELPQSSNLGRRVMMTQDMHDIKGAGDGLWRKEHNVVSRTLVVEQTEGVESGMFTNEGFKPLWSAGRDYSFSQPIGEYLKPFPKP